MRVKVVGEPFRWGANAHMSSVMMGGHESSAGVLTGNPKMNKLRKSESSSLQLALPFETIAAESDTDESLKKLDELDLMALIYEAGNSSGRRSYADCGSRLI